MKNECSNQIGTGLSVTDRASLISLIGDGTGIDINSKPVLSELYGNLWDLVDQTISGSKIDKLNPTETRNGFNVLELNSDNGENLGRLNMLHLEKPLSCHYLVYVEVTPFFRRKGLGHMILAYFRDFLEEKQSIGILDNIIPKDDPTYSIYFKQAWEPIDRIIEAPEFSSGNYMVYVPKYLRRKNIEEAVIRLLNHIKKERASIDMRDNEMMVEKTLYEFKEMYHALLDYFKRDIAKKNYSSFLKYMFTRYVTQLVSFRRDIGELIGYTGGESIEQIKIDDEILSLHVEYCIPHQISGNTITLTGDRDISRELLILSDGQPARFIERLPIIEHHQGIIFGKSVSGVTLRDLLDSESEIDSWRQFELNGRWYTIQRIQGRGILKVEQKQSMASILTGKLNQKRINQTPLKINSPQLLIKDAGNAYIVRNKIAAIHWEDAITRLSCDDALKGLNKELKIDILIRSGVRKVSQYIQEIGDQDFKLTEQNINDVSIYVSWDLNANRPLLYMDFGGVSLESLWIQ